MTEQDPRPTSQIETKLDDLLQSIRPEASFARRLRAELLEKAESVPQKAPRLGTVRLQRAWPVSSVSWGPDGKWLAFAVLNTDLITPTSTAGLLNVETCQVVPLVNLDGAIQSWVGP